MNLATDCHARDLHGGSLRQPIVVDEDCLLDSRVCEGKFCLTLILTLIRNEV